MEFNLMEWLNLIARWVHIFAAILWVGTTYYFTWLDGQLKKLDAGERGPSARVWMVHSGGFYTVEKQGAAPPPEIALHWFRWEAAITWLSGFVLLTVVYYMGGTMVDDTVAKITVWAATGIGLATLIFGWAIYDLLWISPLGKNEAASVAISFAITAALTYALCNVMSGRAAYMHVGALFGTIMTANVWMRILPAQKKMVAAAREGNPYDPALSARAKMRSKHNTYLVVPTVFIMISNHFPVATYGDRYNWAILLVMILLGWVAAAWLRRT
jgi:uncharacterized membrane protein